MKIQASGRGQVRKGKGKVKVWSVPEAERRDSRKRMLSTVLDSKCLGT